MEEERDKRGNPARRLFSGSSGDDSWEFSGRQRSDSQPCTSRLVGEMAAVCPLEVDNSLRNRARMRLHYQVKENFGVDLPALLSGNSRLPRILVFLCEFLHDRGRNVPNLFRIRADPATFEKFEYRMYLNRGEFQKCSDPVVLASILQQFCKELPTSLIPERFFTRCIDAVDEYLKECQETVRLSNGFVRRFLPQNVAQVVSSFLDNSVVPPTYDLKLLHSLTAQFATRARSIVPEIQCIFFDLPLSYRYSLEYIAVFFCKMSLVENMNGCSLKDISHRFANHILRPVTWNMSVTERQREVSLVKRFVELFFLFVKKKHNLLTSAERAELELDDEEIIENLIETNYPRNADEKWYMPQVELQKRRKAEYILPNKKTKMYPRVNGPTILVDDTYRPHLTRPQSVVLPSSAFLEREVAHQRSADDSILRDYDEETKFIADAREQYYREILDTNSSAQSNFLNTKGKSHRGRKSVTDARMDGGLWWTASRSVSDSDLPPPNVFVCTESLHQMKTPPNLKKWMSEPYNAVVASELFAKSMALWLKKKDSSNSSPERSVQTLPLYPGEGLIHYVTETLDRNCSLFNGQFQHVEFVKSYLSSICIRHTCGGSPEHEESSSPVLTNMQQWGLPALYNYNLRSHFPTSLTNESSTGDDCVRTITRKYPFDEALNVLNHEFPSLSKGDSCEGCGARKSSSVLRFVHCSYCGRLLCADCGSRRMMIPARMIRRDFRSHAVCKWCEQHLENYYTWPSIYLHRLVGAEEQNEKESDDPSSAKVPFKLLTYWRTKVRRLLLFYVLPACPAWRSLVGLVPFRLMSVISAEYAKCKVSMSDLRSIDDRSYLKELRSIYAIFENHIGTCRYCSSVEKPCCAGDKCECEGMTLDGADTVNVVACSSCGGFCHKECSSDSSPQSCNQCLVVKHEE